ncbi:hypothetical protein Tco_0290526 [Tanacetum coccineum]
MSLVLKAHGLVSRVVRLPRGDENLSHGVVMVIDIDNERGCFDFDLRCFGYVSFGVSSVMTGLVVVKVVWEVMGTRLAVEVARRFEASLSLAMVSSKATIDSLRRDCFDVGGGVYEV